MTTPMENTVRPFMPVPIHPAKVVLPAAGLPKVVECHLGGAGGISTSFTVPNVLGATTIDKQGNYKESDRKSTLVRVENPDDSSQYVEFCRADKITLTQKKEKKPPAPTRTTSYDTSGGMHGSSGDREVRNYEFQYPTTRACTPRQPPKGGNC